jgi:formylglycine-generating enzyme required for sulfatase activity
MSGFDDDLHTQRSLGRWLPEIPEVPLEQRYEVAGEPIGKGGFGDVYRAKKRLLPQWVAVKRLRSDTGKHPPLEEQRRFVREVTLAASLDHPHIVRIEDWGRDAQGLYVVMALIEGGSLLQQVDQHGAVPLGKLLQYARQICLGLQAAHQQGIIHRDLKPANMLLDKTGRVLLADFGLARSSAGSREALIHSSGKPMYSFAYASPEQLAGESLDARTDLFSLGATLYHLAAGQPAYDRDFDLDAIPAELQALISGLLKKKRDQRLATVDVVLDQLTELQKRRVSGTTPPQPSGSQVNRGAASPAASVKPAEEDLASLVEKVLARVTAQQAQARGLLSQQRYAEAVAALEEVPEAQRHLLDASLYQECVALRDRVQSLDQEIKAAVLGARFDGVREKITALQELQPWRTDLERLLKTLPAKPVDTTPAILTAPFDARAAKAAQVALAKSLRQPEEWSNSVGMKFRAIPAGTFLMGSAEGEGEDDERPQHQVTITKPFWLGVHQVTQEQWRQVLGTTPWKGQSYTIEGSDVAASYVSWDDAVEFCERLSQKEGRRYRLPSEAEWEYACRAGTTTKYGFGDDKQQLGEYAWFDGNAWSKGEKYAHRVGQKGPNAFGLYDVHGNVWEWCADWFDAGYYAKAPASDPAGPPSGSFRVLRGGSWNGVPIGLRSSSRSCSTPGNRSLSLGCRVVLECG